MKKKLKGCCDAASMTKWGLFLLRLSVGVIFLYHGWGKLTNMEATIGFFTSLSFPAAAFWAYVVALVEFLGGVALILGIWTRLAAKLLAITMLVALLTVHLNGGFAQAELVIALLGSTLAITMLGGGEWQWMAGNECPAWCDMRKKK
jgi:putative oxidoreductase